MNTRKESIVGVAGEPQVTGDAWVRALRLAEDALGYVLEHGVLDPKHRQAVALLRMEMIVRGRGRRKDLMTVGS